MLERTTATDRIRELSQPKLKRLGLINRGKLLD